MDKSNRLALRIVGLTVVIVILGAVKVNNGFNRMVQPPEPLALIQWQSTSEDKPGVGSAQTGKTSFAVLGIAVNFWTQPVEKVKSDLLEVGIETRHRIKLWLEDQVRTTGNDVASKKR